MTKKEIEERIEKLENSLWYHNMADRWDFWEQQEVEKERAELWKLKEELKNF